ncbi:hypothetical protein KWH04_18130 [Xanthomonas campestris pv. trichodesmae]|uniref:hypothetical protein n=1 Tax=Xanthomonas citri TaxID=346 RepID=UPI001ABF0538|nr:hypothetical protein [Xanthomonas citri]MBV6782526.1 hypothetical protein [Xanthomonas campestris pv. trichodesmae]
MQLTDRADGGNDGVISFDAVGCAAPAPAEPLTGPEYVAAELMRLRADPVRCRNIGFALRLADEVSPSPAAAHTALLVLRDLVLELAGQRTVEQQQRHISTWR